MHCLLRRGGDCRQLQVAAINCFQKGGQMINLGFTIAEYPIVRMGSLRLARFALPLQVAAVCYRWRGSSAEFLLVNTNGGGKWTFPKGDPHRHLSHSQAARREALEEAGGTGRIEPRHFHLYIHSKGVFWQTARGTGVCHQSVSA